MKKMEWLIDNWYIIVPIVCLALVIIYEICAFFKMPTPMQVKKIKEWLVWACIEAEKELQSGTGQAKLRKVYDMFCAVPAFEWVAKIISFDTFSEWVDESLVIVKELLQKNPELAKYVYEDNAKMEIEKIKEQLQEG